MRPVSPASAFTVAALGIGLFSVMDAFMKSLTLSIGVYNALFWRMAASSVLGAGLWAREGAPRPAARTMRLHLARGAIGAGMAVLFFWGLARVPMAQAITLAYVAPLAALLLGALFLGERVGGRVVVGSVAAIGGVGLMLAGDHAAITGGRLDGAGAILASALLYAVNLVLARAQSQAAKPGEIAFFQSAVMTLILLAAAPWLAVWPEAALWPRILAAAMLATGSLALLGWAYAHGPAGFLATTEYTSFVYAAALGWLVFGEPVSAWTLAGAAIIVAACLYAARRRDIAGAGELQAGA